MLISGIANRLCKLLGTRGRLLWQPSAARRKWRERRVAEVEQLLLVEVVFDAVAVDNDEIALLDVDFVDLTVVRLVRPTDHEPAQVCWKVAKLERKVELVLHGRRFEDDKGPVAAQRPPDQHEAGIAKHSRAETAGTGVQHCHNGGGGTVAADALETQA